MPLGFARLNTISRVLGSAAPTYEITESTTSVNEGSSVTFTITTTNVADGTTLYWSTETVTGTINTSDFTGAAVTGSFTVNSNTGSVVRTIASDATTEGSESFRLQIRTDSTAGDIVATSNTVTINDTSLTATYAVSPAANNVDEGSSLQFNVTTTNVANGTTLYWTLTNSGDFATSSGSFTINSNAGSFSVTPTADNTTEGAETFQAQVRTGSTSGTIRATSSAVTINDTSLNPYYYLTIQHSGQGGPYGSGLTSDGRLTGTVLNTGTIFSLARGGTSAWQKNTSTSFVRNAFNASNISNTNLMIGYTGSDYYFLQFDNTGAITRQFRETNATNVVWYDTCETSAGNMWIVGNSNLANYGLWFRIAPNGSITQRHFTAGAGSNVVEKVCVDSSDNVYGLGWAAGNFTVFKGGTTGAFTWRRSYAGTSAFRPVKCQVEGSYLYVICNISTTVTGIFKYDLNGTLQWSKQLTRYAFDAVVNSTGIYILSHNTSSGGQVHYWTELDLNGNYVRGMRFYNTALVTNAQYTLGLGVSSDGNEITISGRITPNFSNFRFFSMCVPSDGTKTFQFVDNYTFVYGTQNTAYRTVLSNYTLNSPTTTTISYSTSSVTTTNTSITVSDTNIGTISKVAL